MLESSWLFVGAIAFIMTLVTLGAAAFENPGDDVLTMITGTVGFVSWGVWTFGTLDITVISQGTELSFSQPELTFLGIVMALVPGYLALTGPFELVKRARDTEMGDV